jgi:hypothetical protein
MVDRVPSLCDLVQAGNGASSSEGGGEQPVSRGGVATPFPWKLHDMLDSVEEQGLQHIVSWQIHGRCFAIHNVQEFVPLISTYFNQTKLASFQRQLNLCKYQLVECVRSDVCFSSLSNPA